MTFLLSSHITSNTDAVAWLKVQVHGLNFFPKQPFLNAVCRHECEWPAPRMPSSVRQCCASLS